MEVRRQGQFYRCRTVSVSLCFSVIKRSHCTKSTQDHDLGTSVLAFQPKNVWSSYFGGRNRSAVATGRSARCRVFRKWIAQWNTNLFEDLGAAFEFESKIRSVRPRKCVVVQLTDRH